MKIPISLFLLALVLSVGHLTFAAAPDTLVAPPMQWAREHAFDVKHLQLDLQFDWVTRQAFGRATLTLEPFKPVAQIELDAAHLQIQSITEEAGTVLSYSYDGSDQDNALRIQLPRLYQPGESIVIQIDYRTQWVNEIDPQTLGGNNGKGLRFSHPTRHDPLKPKEVWSMGDPQGNRYWFPGYDAPNDWRTTDIRLTVDTTQTALASGALVSIDRNGNGTQTFRYRSNEPYPNHLTSVVVGEYADVPQHYDGVTIHNYCYPREVEATRASVERLPDMMRFFSEKTGLSYPFGEYRQVFVQDLPWGVGNHMLAVQSENMVDDDGTHEDFLYLWDALEGETLAQQWFGNTAGFGDWKDVWLSKGLAIYLSRLYNEHKNGQEEFLLFQPANDLGTYLWEWQAGVRHPIVTQQYDNVEQFVTFDNIPTLKAGLVLHMLRKELGEECWWTAIRIFLPRQHSRPTSTESLRLAVEEASGRPMDWFFDQWIYRMGHPVFEVRKEYDASSKKLWLHVIQTQSPDSVSYYPAVAFFRGKMVMTIDHRLYTVELEPKKRNTFSFDVDSAPSLVHVDHEQTWIKEMVFQKSITELLYQVRFDSDVLGRRWAMGQLAARYRSDTLDVLVKKQIREVLMETARSHSYWRMRLVALSTLQSLVAPASESKPVALDKHTVEFLLHRIANEKSWAKASAIAFLGMTRDARYDQVYRTALSDRSDRVVNQAAIALGKCKSKHAFQWLSQLPKRPSWKNQSLMSALAGLRELGDPRGYVIAIEALQNRSLHRWRLPVGSVWDLRVFAVQTIQQLGRGKDAYPLLKQYFDEALQEDDLEGIFFTANLMTVLGDPRGKEIIPVLQKKYENQPSVMIAVDQLATQLATD